MNNCVHNIKGQPPVLPYNLERKRTIINAGCMNAA